MAGLIPVRELTSVAEMRAHYAALRRRTFAPRVIEAKLAWAPPTAAQQQAASDLAWSRPIVTQRLVLRTAAQIQGRSQSSLSECLRAAAEVAGLSVGDLVRRNRTPPVVRARQIACWLGARHGSASYPQIARRLGGRNHTTILHAVRRVQALIDSGPVELSPDLAETARALWTAWSGVD